MEERCKPSLLSQPISKSQLIESLETGFNVSMSCRLEMGFRLNLILETPTIFIVRGSLQRI